MLIKGDSFFEYIVEGGVNVLKKLIVFSGILLVVLSVSSFAAVPRVINFQGKLTSLLGTPETGGQSLVFKIWSHATSSDIGYLKWTSSVMSVTPDYAGQFSVVLESGSPSLDTVNFNQALWLEIVDNNTSFAFAPRQRLTAVPYSFYSITSESGGGGGGGGGWTEDVGGNKVYVTDVGRNVGIGTTDPRATLEVTGDTLVTGALYAGSIGATGGKTGAVSFGGVYGIYDGFSINNGTGSLRFAADSNPDSFFVLNADGLVGIGTNAPTKKLTVAGTLKVVGSAEIGDASCEASGPYSVAMGLNTTASGFGSLAIGENTSASGNTALAMGASTTASDGGIAMGENTSAGGAGVAMGHGAKALSNSIALGTNSIASDTSTSIGYYTNAIGYRSTAMGFAVSSEAGDSIIIGSGYTTKISPLAYLSNNIPSSFMVGYMNSTEDVIPELFVKDNAVCIGTTIETALLTVAGTIDATEYYKNGAPFSGGSSQWTDSGGGISYNAGNVGIGTPEPLSNKLSVLADSSTAIYGETADPSGNGYGVYGYANFPGNQVYGVYGLANSYAGSAGVKGESGFYGVYGISSSPLSDFPYIGAGVIGTNTSGGLAGYFNGKVYVTSKVGIGTFEPTVALKVVGSAEIGAANCSATGANSIAMGDSTVASGNRSTAMGYYSVASGEYSTAMGASTVAGGWDSFAMGYQAAAFQNYSSAMGYRTIANGEGAIAMGYNTNAYGAGSYAMGNITNASGEGAIAMGYNTNALGTKSTAMGNNTLASGPNSTAMGYYTIASGESSVAIGSKIKAEGDYSVGIGLTTEVNTITQPNTMAIMGGKVGIGTTQPASKLTVGGTIEITSGSGGGIKFPTGNIQYDAAGASQWTDSVSGIYYNAGKVGIGTPEPLSRLSVGGSGVSGAAIYGTSGTYGVYGKSTAELYAVGAGVAGYNTSGGLAGYFSGTVSMMSGNVGIGTTMPASKLSVGGNGAAGYAGYFTGNTKIVGSAEIGVAGCSANGQNSIAMGNETHADGTTSTAMGSGTSATGQNSTAIGESTSATALDSTAMGYSTSAGGAASIAMGHGTAASGESSVAMGYGISALKDHTFGIGLNETSYSINTANTMAIMGGNVGIGTTSPTVALKVVGSAEIGSDTCSARGQYSVAMGFRTTASGFYSTAMGGGMFDPTTASGDYSTAMGYETTASGSLSTTMGWGTKAMGSRSTAMGQKTTAQPYASLAIGQYNITSDAYTTNSWVGTDPVFIIGNGTALESPSNAMTVLQNGKVGIGTTAPASKLSVGGTGITNAAIYGTSDAYGVYGSSTYNSTSESYAGVYGSNTSGGWAGYFANNVYMGGRVGISATTPLSTLSVGGNGISGTTIYATSITTGSKVIYGEYPSTIGAGGTGVYGLCNGPAVGVGVSGRCTGASTGGSIGVLGSSDSFGVKGVAAIPDNSTGYGVYGDASGKNGTPNPSTAYGLYGKATAFSATGVYGTANGSYGAGVYGNAENSNVNAGYFKGKFDVVSSDSTAAFDVSNTGVVTYPKQPCARAWLNNAFHVHSSTPSKIPFDSKAGSGGWDVPGNFFDNITNYRLIFPVNGYYLINARVMFNSVVANGCGQIYLLKNGVGAPLSYGQANTHGGSCNVAANISDIVCITNAPNDYIEVWGTTYGDIGVQYDLDNSSGNTFISATLLH